MAKEVCDNNDNAEGRRRPSANVNNNNVQYDLPTASGTLYTIWTHNYIYHWYTTEHSSMRNPHSTLKVAPATMQEPGHQVVSTVLNLPFLGR